MTEGLIIAIPSKGRLQENTEAFFARAGLDIRRAGGARNYRGRLEGIEGAEVAFLSAGEIVRELAEGNVHLGVTGEDLVRETVPDADGVLQLVTKLGFGHADVVVAVPRSWIDVRSIADLADVAAGFRAIHGRGLRVATKYGMLLRRFFAASGIADYRVVESLGATEGAPAAGTADIIVDITSTGSTLAANDLKVPAGATILESQANLVASLRANWCDAARDALSRILDQVAAEERARQLQEVRADWERDAPARDLGPVIAETGAIRISDTDGLLILHVPHAGLYTLAAGLKRAGAIRVSVFRPDYVFEAENPLLARLLAAIDGADR